MATTSDLSNGAFIVYNGELTQVTEYSHVTPGKGKAYYQVKMRNTRTGRSVEHRFRSGETIEFVQVFTRELQYLYREGTSLVCMDNESFEQLPIEDHLFGDGVKFIKEGDNVSVSFRDGEQPISATVPTFVEVEVTYTEPGIRGDTATNTLKPATIETGAEIMIPLFCDIGEKIKVDTRTGTYVERVK